jgi:hypothetical protein
MYDRQVHLELWWGGVSASIALDHGDYSDYGDLNKCNNTNTDDYGPRYDSSDSYDPYDEVPCPPNHGSSAPTWTEGKILVLL